MMAMSLYPVLFSSVVLLFCRSVAHSEETSNSQIIHLNDGNFDDVVGKAELILVEFYVDWWVDILQRTLLR